VTCPGETGPRGTDPEARDGRTPAAAAAAATEAEALDRAGERMSVRRPRGAAFVAVDGVALPGEKIILPPEVLRLPRWGMTAFEEAAGGGTGPPGSRRTWGATAPSAR